MRVSRAGRGGALTELEGAVLGAISLHAPCTPYRVRRVFLDSPSPYWSGSAGAIYPLIARLRRRGMVRSTREVSGGGRAARLYALTPRGRGAFRTWVKPPWSAAVTGIPADPLRTRVSFLGTLSAPERARFWDEAIAAVEPDLRRHERERRAGWHAGERWEAVVAEGALETLRARLAWLSAARESDRAPRLHPRR